MDEATFQLELLDLKHRVSQIASTYQRSPPPPMVPSYAYSQDGFANHLDDVKRRLQNMQANLGHLTAAKRPHMGPSNSYSSEPPSHVNLQNNYTLPTGPLFWQLFTSLRTDIRGLDERVVNLEIELADLEDRIDGLDPNQLTPAGSEEDDRDARPYAWNSVPVLETSFPNRYATGDRDPVSHMSSERINTINELDSANVKPSFIVGQVHHNHAAPAPAPEGVAFRDREIAQLEELMRAAQENLRRSEDLMNQKDIQIQQLSSDRDSASAKISELERVKSEHDNTIHTYGKVVAENRDEIDGLRARCQTQDAALQAWASKYRATEQSLLRRKTQLAAASHQIQQLQQAVFDVQGSKQDAIEEITANKEDEIRRLRDFCDAKQSVLYSQEQIIARGASIIKDRDDEIERLDRQLKILTDDSRNETRERARLARLLDERDEDIVQLQTSLTQAMMPKEAVFRGGSEVLANKQMPCSPFATVGANAQMKGHIAPQWTPKAFANYGQLPHEQQRASVWGAEQAPGHKVGVPTASSSSTLQQSTKVPKHVHGDLRRSESVKLLKRLTVAETHQPTGSTAQHREETRRKKLPLDNFALCAPLPLQKAASLVDLGKRGSETDGTARQAPISKRQSMQELPRRGLQAFAEDGEKGREGYT